MEIDIREGKMTAIHRLLLVGVLFFLSVFIVAPIEYKAGTLVLAGCFSILFVVA